MLHRHFGKYFLKRTWKLGSSISKCVTLKMTACSRLSITAYFPFDGQMLVNRAANGFAAVMKDSFFFRSHCEYRHLPPLPHQAALTALNPSRPFLYRLYWNRSAAEGGGLKWVASLHLLSPIHHLFSLGCIAAVSFSVTRTLSGLRGSPFWRSTRLPFLCGPAEKSIPDSFVRSPTRNSQFASMFLWCVVFRLHGAGAATVRKKRNRTQCGNRNHYISLLENWNGIFRTLLYIYCKRFHLLSLVL